MGETHAALLMQSAQAGLGVLSAHAAGTSPVCAQLIAALSLQLLSRWAFQTQRRVASGQVEAASSPQLAHAIAWIIREAPAMACCDLPHVPAAAILLCGAALQGTNTLA